MLRRGAGAGGQPSLCPSGGSPGRERAARSAGQQRRSPKVPGLCSALHLPVLLGPCFLPARRWDRATIHRAGVWEALAFGQSFLLDPASRKPLYWQCPWRGWHLPQPPALDHVLSL